MNRIGTISLLALGVAALNSHALEVRQSPYDKIAERNLFQLRTPVPPIVDAIPKPNPLRKLTLTGITTILGKRLAFITIEGTKSQPAESVIIAEGAAVNGIEMKEIDEKAGVVRVLSDGKLQILNFEPAKPSGREPVQIQVSFAAPTALVKAKHMILPPTDLNPNE